MLVLLIWKCLNLHLDPDPKFFSQPINVQFLSIKMVQTNTNKTHCLVSLILFFFTNTDVE